LDDGGPDQASLQSVHGQIGDWPLYCALYYRHPRAELQPMHKASGSTAVGRQTTYSGIYKRIKDLTVPKSGIAVCGPEVAAVCPMLYLYGKD